MSTVCPSNANGFPQKERGTLRVVAREGRNEEKDGERERGREDE